MAVRGRKPKPTAVKKLAGNPGKRALNPDEPQPGALGPPPNDWPEVAAAKWREVTQPEVWGQVATAADRDQLLEYCLLAAKKAEAEGKVAEHGPVVASPNGFPVQSPWVQIVNKCRAEMLKIATEFGGTPSSRARVGVANAPKPRGAFEGF